MNVIADTLASHGALGEKISSRLGEVEAKLEKIASENTPLLNEATSHLVRAGGKRLRPLLCLLTAELGAEPDNGDVLDVAVAVELTHLASLYHDDVMDDAALRRGVPTAQKLYGNSAAIMAGDLLFAQASLVISGLGEAAVKRYARTFQRLCYGQLQEAMGPEAGKDPRTHYLEVLSDKTGSLIAAAARDGVLAARGSQEIAAAVAQYAEYLGIAFQLADDVLDLQADSDIAGKIPGTDLLENVSTMPTLLLAEQKRAGMLDIAGEEIMRMLAASVEERREQLPRLLDLLSHHAVVEQTRAIAEEYCRKGLAELEILPAGEVKAALTDFAHMMVDRQQ